MAELGWYDIFLQSGGHLQVLSGADSRNTVLTATGAPMVLPVGGYRPRGLLRLGADLSILELTGPDGDTVATLLGSDLRAMPWPRPARHDRTDDAASRLSAAIEPVRRLLLEDPWAAADDPGFQAFAALSASTRRAVMSLVGAPTLPDAPPPRRRGLLNPADEALVWPNALQRLVALDWRDEVARLLRTGTPALPSLSSQGDAESALIVAVDSTSLVAHVRDTRSAETWLVGFGLRGKGSVSWVWRPAQAQFFWIAMDPVAASDQLATLLVAYAAAAPHFRNLVQAPRGLAFAYQPIKQYHFGHLIWNSLSGLQRIASNAGPPAAFPTIFDLSNDLPRSEIFGAIEDIFPEASGSVRRDAQSMADAMALAAKAGQRLVAYAGLEVQRSLRQRIVSSVLGQPTVRSLAPFGDLGFGGSAGRPRPLGLALGLRLQDRSVQDMAAFYASVTERLLMAAGDRGLTVVIDGMNAPPARSARVGAVLDVGSAMQTELGFVEDFRARVTHLPVSVLSCVGMAVPENLFWLSMCQFFVAPMGAGLVKYRWVLNLPGMALVSRMNLKFSRYYRVYGDTGDMEDPSPIHYTEPDEVQDLFPAGQEYTPKGRSKEVWRGDLSPVNFAITDPTKVLNRIEHLFTRTIAGSGA